MKVKLVQATPNPLKLITDVASICYNKSEATFPLSLLKHLYNGGHHSTFEHVYFTFKIDGISRACLAQLTRHRHASYSVRSQRYCDEGDRNYIIPPKIESSEYKEEYHQMIMSIYDFYDKMLKNGIKKEDARSILGNSTSTDLYMSMNLRELIHVYKLRTHSSAQEEISNLIKEMVNLVLSESPEIKILF